ncbi:hypothetical protein GCM10023347_39280 [Streptomyces chumphonensis]|uniref:Uncharacterized protein n=1 Tax=Streptomyces chumphonensis TaxID=1214925 RepID=A0A927IA36_9ACTN|nr:hypothetical protein [Streptomyces chumphonensis]MBD3930553.1 hypothetical protein [Streptomyces chumphonensis]
MTRPTTGQRVAAVVLLLLADLLVVGCLLWGYLWTGWLDGWNEGHPPEAPGLAREFMWYLAGGAVVTAGALAAFGRGAYATVQLVVLGGGAATFAALAAQKP